MSIERRLERLEAASVLSQHLQPIEVLRRLSQSEEEVLDQLEASGRIVRADRDRVQFIVIETWRDRRLAKKSASQRPSCSAQSSRASPLANTTT
jgi:hypothetical protein